jgi:hypothetical protein
MSQYVTKRAQEAAEGYAVAMKAAKEALLVRNEATLRYNEASVQSDKASAALKAAMRTRGNARRELDDALRTEQIVASGDAVDVSSLLDGAL